jgi:long-chain acyl-CoA synthetase
MPDLETLQDLLRRFGTRGDRPAIIAGSSDCPETISFAELCAAADRIAHAIRSRGLERDDAVGLMASNGPAWIEAFWGIVAAGQPVMPLDAQTAEPDLRRALALGGCRLLLAGPAQLDWLRLCQLPCEIAALGPSPAAAAASGPGPGGITSGGDVAVLAFTSGTTGTPKPVPLTHANLLSNVAALLALRVIGLCDRALVPLPLHHTYPLTVGMLTVLASGAAMILPAGLSGPELLDAIRRGRATALVGVPRLYGAILANVRAAAARSGLGALLFPALLAVCGLVRRRCGLPLGRFVFRSLRARLGPELRLLVSGGAALPVEDEAALSGLGWEILTGYGLTETSPILTFNRPGQSRIGSAGQALPRLGRSLAARGHARPVPAARRRDGDSAGRAVRDLPQSRELFRRLRVGRGAAAPALARDLLGRMDGAALRDPARTALQPRRAGHSDRSRSRRRGGNSARRGGHPPRQDARLVPGGHSQPGRVAAALPAGHRRRA